MPWTNQTGLAKMATISALLLLLSAGLCGANLALFSRYGTVSGGAPGSPRSAGVSTLLIATGVAESIGIGVGFLGLLVTGLLAIMNVVRRSLNKGDDA